MLVTMTKRAFKVNWLPDELPLNIGDAMGLAFVCASPAKIRLFKLVEPRAKSLHVREAPKMPGFFEVQRTDKRRPEDRFDVFYFGQTEVKTITLDPKAPADFPAWTLELGEVTPPRHKDIKKKPTRAKKMPMVPFEGNGNAVKKLLEDVNRHLVGLNDCRERAGGFLCFTVLEDGALDASFALGKRK